MQINYIADLNKPLQHQYLVTRRGARKPIEYIYMYIFIYLYGSIYYIYIYTHMWCWAADLLPKHFVLIHTDRKQKQVAAAYNQLIRNEPLPVI